MCRLCLEDRRNLTHPSDPFHLVVHHVLLLRTDDHSRSNYPHVRYNLLSGKEVLVDQVG